MRNCTVIWRSVVKSASRGVKLQLCAQVLHTNLIDIPQPPGTDMYDRLRFLWSVREGSTGLPNGHHERSRVRERHPSSTPGSLPASTDQIHSGLPFPPQALVTHLLVSGFGRFWGTAAQRIAFRPAPHVQTSSIKIYNCYVITRM